MKIKSQIFLLVVMVISISSCEIDNYEEPQLTLTGKIVDSQTGGLIESGGINGGTTIELYEVGSGQPLILNTLPDGTFSSSKIFSGNYVYSAKGPFEMAVEDTLNLLIQEDTEIEIQVIPNVRLNASLEEVNGTTAEINLEYEKMAVEQDFKEMGIVWSEYRNPNIYAYPDGGIITEAVNDSLTPSVGVKNFVIEGLKSNTTYYVRGWAVTANPGNYFNYSAQLEISTE